MPLHIFAPTASHDSSKVVAADVAGTVQLVDVGKMKACGRLVGPAGAVRSMAKHPSQPLLAVVGLDRMLRVYDMQSRKQRAMFYLKQRLTAVLFSDELAKKEAMGLKDLQEAEDDVGSLDESESDDDGGGGGKWNGNMKYDRISDEEEVDDSGDNNDEEGQDDDKDSDEEEAYGFGARQRRKDDIELHITGKQAERDGSADEDEEDDADEEEGEDDDGEEEEEGGDGIMGDALEESGDEEEEEEEEEEDSEDDQGGSDVGHEGEGQDGGQEDEDDDEDDDGDSEVESEGGDSEAEQMPVVGKAKRKGQNIFKAVKQGGKHRPPPRSTKANGRETKRRKR